VLKPLTLFFSGVECGVLQKHMNREQQTLNIGCRKNHTGTRVPKGAVRGTKKTQEIYRVDGGVRLPCEGV